MYCWFGILSGYCFYCLSCVSYVVLDYVLLIVVDFLIDLGFADLAMVLLFLW